MCSLSFKLAYFLVETCDAKGQRSCANTCAQEGLALQRQRAAQISELRSGIKLLGSNDEQSCMYLDLIWIPRCMQDILMPIHKASILIHSVIKFIHISIISYIKTLDVPTLRCDLKLPQLRQRTALIGKAKSERLASDKDGLSELQAFGGRIMAHTNMCTERDLGKVKWSQEPRFRRHGMLQFLLFSARLCIQELEQLRQNLPSLETEEQKAREVLEAAEAAVEEEQRLALANETEGNRSADGADTPEPVQEPTSKSDSASAGVDIADRAQKPVVSEYSKWMDGAEKVLEADGEEKPVVSEYSKWMDGAEKVLEPKDSMGSEHQKAADSPDTTEPDVPDAGADGTPGLTRLTTKLRDLWSSFKGWIFGNKTAAEKALDRARELHNAAKKKLKKDRVKMAQLAPRRNVMEHGATKSGD